jgi:hypothetical protein
MPKKKLTKAQVKATFVGMHRAVANLLQDKINYPDSKVPMSLQALIKLKKDATSAFNRVK